MIPRWIIHCLMSAYLISLTHLVRSMLILNGPRTVLLSIHRLLLMTFGLMKASVVRSALRLLRSVLVPATVGNLKPIKLQSLSLLSKRLIFLVLLHNLLLVL